MKSKIKDDSIKRLTIFALISVAISILTAVGVFAYFFVDRDAEREIIEIPTLVGQRFENIGSFDEIIIESQPVFSDEIPEGEIISQFPYGGAKRKIGSGEKYTVRLTVSLGKETCEVPELQNFKYADAAVALRTLGAKIRIVSVFDDEAQADLVQKTSPVAGERIHRGDTVTLFVSRNHVHAPVMVKNYVGLPIETAVTEMLAQGLLLGDVTFVCSHEIENGTVISQSIKSDSLVPYGSYVDFVVSEGKKAEDIHPFRGNFTEKNGEINGND